MNLQSFVDHMELNGFGVSGVDLFRENMPAECDRGYLFIILMPVSIDPYTHLRRGEFELIARSGDSDEAKKMVFDAIESLSMSNRNVGDEMYYYIRPKHEPLTFPRSDGSHIEASVTFECCFRT